MINETLLNAYRYHRQITPRQHLNAVNALKRARDDVAADKARYSAATGYGPAYEARGSKQYRWIEKPSACGLRFVGYASDIVRLDHTGWYVDNDQNETVKGVVFQLPGRDGKPLFVAGYEDWNNGRADSDGPVTLDFGNVSLTHDGARDAARRADQIAQWIAEDEREYQAAWQAGNRFAELGSDIADSRNAIKALLAERRAAKAAKLLTYPTICDTIRRAVENALGDIATARAEREKLREGDYVSEWLPGFSTHDKRLCEAFNEGASEAVFAS
jgi:hypothetical protein